IVPPRAPRAGEAAATVASAPGRGDIRLSGRTGRRTDAALRTGADLRSCTEDARASTFVGSGAGPAVRRLAPDGPMPARPGRAGPRNRGGGGEHEHRMDSTRIDRAARRARARPCERVRGACSAAHHGPATGAGPAGAPVPAATPERGRGAGCGRADLPGATEAGAGPGRGGLRHRLRADHPRHRCGHDPPGGQMQATLEDPTGEAAEGLETVGGTTSQILATVSSTVVTMIITLVASALVTVVLTRITVGEATGDSVPDGRLWSLLRGQALPAVAVSLLMGVLGSVAFLLPLAVGALPLLVTQEAGWLTIIALLLGLLAGVLAALWVFARTALSLPALAIEGTGVLGSLHRSFQMTAGRKLWRVLGLMLLLVLIFYFAQQIVA